MRKTLFLCGAIGLFTAVSPAFVRAQFQPPNPDELKMTQDPKAPGAAAVYLNIEEIDNDPLHYQSVYQRIKVLTEKGKELATVELPYLKGNWKITDIKGRTVHPDGTIIPLAVKPEDLMIVKSGDLQANKKVFTLPSAEVGSILEYRYEIHYDDDQYSSPRWEIQRPYFVHKAHYEFTPFESYWPSPPVGLVTTVSIMDGRGRPDNALIWWDRLPAGVTIKTTAKSYAVDVSDVPPIPQEEKMPPIQSLIYRVSFYYNYSSKEDEFWTNEEKFWSKDVDNFAEPSKAVKEAVDGLIATTDSDLDKAKKLYDAVEALDNTDYSREKSASEMKELRIREAKHAQDTWAQKSGSSEDIAMLYLAMLRAAGLTAYAIKVVDRDRGLFDPGYLSLEQLDSTLVNLSTGGKQVLLDPGERMCPFQTVSWRHSGTGGIDQTAEGTSFAVTPKQLYTNNTVARVGDLWVDSQGAITGHMNIAMAGQRALHWRQQALKENDAELKKEFDREELEQIVPEGVEAHVDHFLSMDDPYTALMAVVNLKGSLGTATGKRLILPGFLFETRGREPFVNEERRELPVDMHYGDRVTDQVTYHLPDGMTVEGAPQDANISWPGHAVLIAKSVAQPGQITIAQTLSVAFTIAKPEEYQDLRGFYQKVATTDQEQLVLTATAATAVGKGN